MLDAYAAHAGAVLVQPFFDPRFVRALAAHAPPMGYDDRTEALEALFGDVLPSKVLRRATKATFTEALMGPSARTFVKDWDGSGVDTTIVEPAALRAAWEAPDPDARSLPALQQAWLASTEARS